MPGNLPLSRTMLRALRRASNRPRKTLRPIRNTHGTAELALTDALQKRGLIDMNGGAPTINDAGETALKNQGETK